MERQILVLVAWADIIASTTLRALPFLAALIIALFIRLFKP